MQIVIQSSKEQINDIINNVVTVSEELIRAFPNDQELGAYIRNQYYTNLQLAKNYAKPTSKNEFVSEPNY